MIRFIFFIYLLLSINGAASSCDLSIVSVPAISATAITNVSQLQFSKIKKKISATAATNEFEPASFVIYNRGSLPCRDIELSINEFSMNGEFIDRDAIDVDIKIIKRWMQAGGGWKNIDPVGEPKFVPELLVNDDSIIRTDRDAAKNYLKVVLPYGEEYVDISNNTYGNGRVIHDIAEMSVKDAEHLQSFTIEAKDLRQILITFYAREDAKPGKYIASISVNTSQQPYTNIPVILDVLPFNLDNPSIVYSIFYRGILVKGSGTISSEYKNEHQFKAELHNMRKHGVCCPLIYQGVDDKDLFEKNMLIRKGVFGETQTAFIANLSASLATNQNLQRHLQKNIDYLKKHQQFFGVSDYYLFGKDEAKGKALAAQKTSWQFVKSKGMNIFTTGYKGTFDKVGDLLDLLVLAGKPNRSEVEKFHSVGKKVFTYAFPQVGPENPQIFRKNYGLRMWQQGMDGVMPYAYQESFQSTWNDFDHKIYRDHNFTYATLNGVIDTIAWEGFREGVDDVRYITTLENRINKVSTDIVCENNQACSNAIKKSQELLGTLKNSELNDLTAIRKSIVYHIKEMDKFL